VINSSDYLEVNLLLVCHLRLFCFCFLFVVAAVLPHKDLHKYFADCCCNEVIISRRDDAGNFS